MAVAQAAGIVEVSETRIEAETGSIPPGTKVMWSIRPDDVVLTPEGPCAALVLDQVDLGTSSELLLELSNGFELTATNFDHEDLRPGTRCRVALPSSRIQFWPIGTDTPQLEMSWRRP